jgi:putative redox protein
MQASIEEEGKTSAKPDSKEQFAVSINWIHDMQFVASDDHNHSIVLDTTHEGGGHDSGPTPGRLLLMAVACCTAMDVVDILVKSRQNLTGLRVSCRGVQNSEYPKYYKEIYLKYFLRGVSLEKSRVERAIKLSEEKYCSVGATVSGKAQIFITYEIEEEEGKDTTRR